MLSLVFFFMKNTIPYNQIELNSTPLLSDIVEFSILFVSTLPILTCQIYDFGGFYLCFKKYFIVEYAS